MTEPRFVRIPRPSRQIVGILPRCERCDTPLDRLHTRWCKPACCEADRRLRQKWARRLERYWQEQAS